MDPKTTCPKCGRPMWLVVVESSADEVSSHFECFFHIDDKLPEPVAEFGNGCRNDSPRR